MKPVQLLPSEQRSASAGSQDRPITMMIAAGLGIFALVGGYWGYAQVSGMKTETTEMRAEAQATAEKESRVRQEVAELGERTSYSNLAASTESAVTAALEQRFPYSSLLAALDEAVPEKSLWISELGVQISSDSFSSDSTGMSVSGHAVDEVTIAAFHQRLRAMPGLDAVVLNSVRAEPVTDNSIIQTFQITAEVQPSAFTSSGKPATGDLTLVANESGGPVSVALDPVPQPPAQPKPVPKPKPKPKPKTTLHKLAEANQKTAEGTQ